MDSPRFPNSVVIWLDPRRRDFGVKLIENVPEALSALHRHGLEEAVRGPEAKLWKSAAGALVRADVNPSESNLNAAHEAFLGLVKRIAPVPGSIRQIVCPRGLHEQVRSIFLLA